MSEVNANGSYQVQQGDTLWGVANQTGISIDELAAVNGVNPEGIQAGMTLTIPARPSTHDASDPYARAGGIGEGQGSSPGQASETHLTGYLQSLTRDSTRSGKPEGGVDGGSQWERDAFLGSIGEKYRGQSVEQAKQGGLDSSRAQALEGATSEGEKIRINKAFDEAEQRIRGNGETEQIGAKVKDGSLLGKTHEKTIENVQAEKTKALDGITDPRERDRVSAAYDEAVKTLNGNNDAYRTSQKPSSVSPVISSASSGKRAYQDGGPGGTADFLRVDGDFETGLLRTGVRAEGSVVDVTTGASDTSALGDIRVKIGTGGVQLGHNSSGHGAETESSYGAGFNLDAISITKGFGRLQDGRNDTRGEAGLSVGVKSGGFNTTLGDKDGDGSREVGLQVSIPVGPVGITLGGETENTVVVGAVERARDVVDSVKAGFKRLFG